MQLILVECIFYSIQLNTCTIERHMLILIDTILLNRQIYIFEIGNALPSFKL